MRIIKKTMGEDDPECSVIMLTNDPENEVTKKCLRYLEGQVPHELIIIISQPHEHWYGRIVNMGFREASYDIVGILDNDAYLWKDCLRNSLEYVRAYPQIGICGGVQHNNQRKITHIGFRPMYSRLHFVQNALNNKAPIWGAKKLLTGNWQGCRCRHTRRILPNKMIGVNSAFCLQRKECFDDVGPWNEEIRSSGCDPDYSFRVMLHPKWYVSTCLTAHYTHQGGTTKVGFQGFDGVTAQEQFLRFWPMERYKEVLKAAKRGKFFIPKEEHGQFQA